jgi:hypothetical protein
MLKNGLQILLVDKYGDFTDTTLKNLLVHDNGDFTDFVIGRR